MGMPSNHPDDQLVEIATANHAEAGDTALPRRAPARQANQQKGLVIVNTGNGKGKTTAALGILIRAWGRDMQVGGIQFF
jgi:cob(I)alamin adenosyltransferase